LTQLGPTAKDSKLQRAMYQRDWTGEGRGG